MAKRTSDSLDKFIVRLPDGMRDQIAEAAKANGRSMTAEIVSRLEASFGLEPPRRSLELRISALEKQVAELQRVFVLIVGSAEWKPDAT